MFFCLKPFFCLLYLLLFFPLQAQWLSYSSQILEPQTLEVGSTGITWVPQEDWQIRLKFLSLGEGTLERVWGIESFSLKLALGWSFFRSFVWGSWLGWKIGRHAFHLGQELSLQKGPAFSAILNLSVETPFSASGQWFLSGWFRHWSWNPFLVSFLYEWSVKEHLCFFSGCLSPHLFFLGVLGEVWENLTIGITVIPILTLPMAFPFLSWRIDL